MADSYGRGTFLNGIFDFVMENVKHNIATLENYEVVPIPDLFRKKESDLYFTTASASITASQGTLSNLTTLHRVGDVTITTNGNTAFFTAAVALDVLQVVFGHYTLQAALLKKSGDRLTLDVRKNSFDAKLVARMDGLDCDMSLEELVVKEFSDVRVDITGFSVLNPVGRKIAEWFISFFNDFVKDVVETYAKSMVNNVIGDRELAMRVFGNAIHGIVNSSLANSTSNQRDKPVAIQIPNLPLNASDLLNSNEYRRVPNGMLPHTPRLERSEPTLHFPTTITIART